MRMNDCMDQLRAAARSAPGDDRPRTRPGDESGVTIIEVIVSAALMIFIAVSAFTALESASRAGAQERHGARAFAIAQDDQARLRSLKVAQLGVLSETNTVVEDGITYSVVSKGTPKIDRTATQSCQSGNTSADYIAISSTVTWSSMGPRPPVTVESIVAPPSGSLAPNRGALAVSVLDSRNAPSPGITITGTGPTSFSGQTASTGCVIFGDLPAGNYTVAAGPGLVDNDGNPPSGIAASVIGQSSNTLGLQADRPGGFNVIVKTIFSVGPPVATTADTIRVNNTGMSASKGFGTVGTSVNQLTASGLFPFMSAYSAWAGACDSNNPGSGLAFGSSLAPVGGTAATPVTLQLPALDLTVYKGTLATPVGVAPGAKVTITDRNCSIGPNPVKRTLTTNATGKLPNPGLPWSSYDVTACGASTSGTRTISAVNQVVKDPAVPTVLNLYLGGGAAVGVCP